MKRQDKLLLELLTNPVWQMNDGATPGSKIFSRKQSNGWFITSLFQTAKGLTHVVITKYGGGKVFYTTYSKKILEQK